MNIVQLGFGSIGTRHHANLTAMGATYAAGADPIIERVPPNVPRAYVTAEEALQKHAAGNIVIIATPSADHVSQALLALECGAKAILIEKPPSLKAAELDPIIARAKGIPVAAAFNWRYHAVYSDYILPEAHREPRGMLVFMANDDVMSWPNYDRKGWMADPTQGGALLTSAVHAIDLALEALGPVDELTLSQGADQKLADAEIIINLPMHHKSGGNSKIYVAWRKPPFQTVSYDSPNTAMSFSLMDDVWQRARDSMHFLMMRAFLHYAESGDPGRLCTLEQARRVMEVVDAARAAWAQRDVVRLT